MGCINGAKIIIADALSRKQPATNMMTLKSSMTQMGESVVDNTSAANCVGAPVEAKIHEKADAPAVIKSNTPATKPDRKSTRLNSSHVAISYAVFSLKKKKEQTAN